mmetsp:Transcript_102822/g.165651  ORF Transcript_102822/g.165651 Transcript_102822/m.165651 type:complete len:250 (-) Transcript_102822:765-1514(-)
MARQPPQHTPAHKNVTHQLVCQAIDLVHLSKFRLRNVFLDPFFLCFFLFCFLFPAAFIFLLGCRSFVHRFLFSLYTISVRLCRLQHHFFLDLHTTWLHWLVLFYLHRRCSTIDLHGVFYALNRLACIAAFNFDVHTLFLLDFRFLFRVDSIAICQPCLSSLFFFASLYLTYLLFTCLTTVPCHLMCTPRVGSVLRRFFLLLTFHFLLGKISVVKRHVIITRNDFFIAIQARNLLAHHHCKVSQCRHGLR